MKSYLGQMHNVLYLLLTVTQGFCFFYTLTVFVLYGMPIKYFDLKLSTVIVFFFPWETNHDMWVDLEAHISWHLVPSLSCFSKLPFSTRAIPRCPGAPTHIIHTIFKPYEVSREVGKRKKLCGTWTHTAEHFSFIELTRLTQMEPSLLSGIKR